MGGRGNVGIEPVQARGGVHIYDETAFSEPGRPQESERASGRDFRRPGGDETDTPAVEFCDQPLRGRIVEVAGIHRGQRLQGKTVPRGLSSGHACCRNGADMRRPLRRLRPGGLSGHAAYNAEDSLIIVSLMELYVNRVLRGKRRNTLWRANCAGWKEHNYTSPHLAVSGSFPHHRFRACTRQATIHAAFTASWGIYQHPISSLQRRHCHEPIPASIPYSSSDVREFRSAERVSSSIRRVKWLRQGYALTS